MAQNRAHQLLQLAIDSQITQYAAGPTDFNSVISSDPFSHSRLFDSLSVEMVWKLSKSPVKWLCIWLLHIPPRHKCHNNAGNRGYYSPPANLDLMRSITADYVSSISSKVGAPFQPIPKVEFGIIANLIHSRLVIITATVNSVRGSVYHWLCLFRFSCLLEYVHVGSIYKGLLRPRNGSQLFLSLPRTIVYHVRSCWRRIAVSRPYNTHSIAMVFLRDGVLWFLVSARKFSTRLPPVKFLWYQCRPVLAPPQIALFAWGRPSLIQALLCCLTGKRNARGSEIFAVLRLQGAITNPWLQKDSSTELSGTPKYTILCFHASLPDLVKVGHRARS
ncbi:hypothetical protein GGX14DRAFT_403390 [Mycena pura]|uniref:Uncharacterized protein n=1 Tax=Mycena pura TaxID=153505 RepID=A0AAD6UWB2_9AGAR|nr:hypothetical protein GGX14DRAFT_403390 [Mycena pura]